MKLIYAAGAALLLLGCDLHHNRSDHVELILNPSPPGPATTFELRFDQPMAGPDKIGRPAEPSPLIIAPALGGVFTWISPRSGAFAPSEPLALDHRYELSLRSGLAGADGRPSPAFLRQRVQTAPFSVVYPTSWPSQADMNSEQEVTLVFNAPVRAADLAPYVEFRDASGQRRAADLWQGTNEDMPWDYRRWGSPANLASNLVLLVLAAPRQPLPVGKGWRLVLRPGLPAVEKGLRLRTRAEIELGDVRPFVFEEATAHHFIEGGASIVLQFSKPVAPSLTNEWNRWIKLVPLASNITAEIGGRSLKLQGDFNSGTRYRLAVRTGLPAEESFTLDKATETNILMPAIPARLYFPAFSADQQAAGRRQLPLLAVNVPSVRLRAKLLEPEAAIYALRGYDSYFRRWADEGDVGERHRPLDYNLVPGRTVFDQELAGALQSDLATNLILDWDQMLGGRETGVVFVEAERAGGRSESRPRLGTQALIQLTDLGLAWKSAAGEPGCLCLFAAHRTARRRRDRAVARR